MSDHDETTAPNLPDWKLVYAGKVRDLYIPVAATSLETTTRILMVASDRVSAFDFMLEPPIPGKGTILNQITLWWLRQFGDLPNHILTTDVPDAVTGRAVIVKNLNMVPIECVVRGYLTGSGFKEYRQFGTVCGIPLPDGLVDGDQLPEPIFTPAFKAPQGEHDENITFEQVEHLIGEAQAAELRDLSLALYTVGSSIAESRGLILADTKFEFGSEVLGGSLVLADEVLTPDSSRYWDKVAYDAGDRGLSFDKQIVRDWLAANWDLVGKPPELPAEIVAQTAARYQELMDRLTA